MESPESKTVPQWLATAGAYAWRLIAVAAGLYVLGIVFSKLRWIIVPVAAALFFTTILGPPAGWLRRHGVPSLLATWLVFLAMLVVVAAIIAGLVPSVSGEFNQLGHELNQGVKHVEHWLETGPLHLSKRQVSNYVTNLQNALSTNKGTIAKYGLTGATAILQGAAAALLTLVLTFFFVKDGEHIAKWMATINPARSDDLRAVGRAAWSTLTGYVRGAAANGAVNAVLLAIALVCLGVPLVAPIALLTFIGGFIPLVGAIASGLIAALVTLVSNGPLAAVIIVGVTVVIHNVEGYLVGPLVLGRAVRLHPVAVLLSLAVGTAVGGFIGAFLAVPIVAVLLSVNEHYRQKRLHESAEAPAPSGPLYLAGQPPRAENE